MSTSQMMHHLEVRSIPVEEYVLSDVAAYLQTARFDIVKEAEVCTDEILGLKCLHITSSLGIPQGKVG